jgi:hypothetical protein
MRGSSAGHGLVLPWWVRGGYRPFLPVAAVGTRYRALGGLQSTPPFLLRLHPPARSADLDWAGAAGLIGSQGVVPEGACRA